MSVTSSHRIYQNQPRSKMEAVSSSSYIIDGVPVYRRDDGLYELTRFLQDASRIKKLKRKTWKLFKRTNVFKVRVGTVMEEDEDGCGYGNFNLLLMCARYASETLARFIEERDVQSQFEMMWDGKRVRPLVVSELDSEDSEAEDVLDTWNMPNDIELPIPSFDSVAYIDEQIKHFQKDFDILNEQMKRVQKDRDIAEAKLGLYKKMRLELPLKRLR